MELTVVIWLTYKLEGVTGDVGCMRTDDEGKECIQSLPSSSPAGTRTSKSPLSLRLAQVIREDWNGENHMKVIVECGQPGRRAYKRIRCMTRFHRRKTITGFALLQYYS